jgi:hypothetical protein
VGDVGDVGDEVSDGDDPVGQKTDADLVAALLKAKAIGLIADALRNVHYGEIRLIVVNDEIVEVDWTNKTRIR